jgi:thiamine-monophosphate kinase
MKLATGRIRPTGGLRGLGEDRLLAEWLPTLKQNSGVVTGPGDDCAVVRMRGSSNLLLLKTDCVVENVHFTTAARATDVGWKAMARPLSDFAAMSGVPRFALITFIIAPETSLRWTKDFYRGLGKAAHAFGVAIVGGETSRTAGPICVAVSIAGEVEQGRCILRSGGKSGDELFVTGRLGGSTRGRHLDFIPRIRESRWLSANFDVHAMIDLSDGLGADLPRLARASRLGFEIDEQSLPRRRNSTIEQAISDGEDYELLFAVPTGTARSLTSRWQKKFPHVALTRIGRLTRKSKIESRKWHGYDHFQKRG